MAAVLATAQRFDPDSYAVTLSSAEFATGVYDKRASRQQIQKCWQTWP
jgi:hypothetical protein